MIASCLTCLCENSTAVAAIAAQVKLGTHILTSERVAVKILEKERIVEVADVERVAREAI